VESQEQSERQICRVIVLGRDGAEILLKIAGTGFAFPALEIPRWERSAENLTATLRRDWGCDAVCLFTPDPSSADSEHSEVMECLCDQGRKKETAWKPVLSLTADSFENGAEHRILEQCLHQLSRYERDPSSPFGRRGWLDELRCWTAEVIRPLRLRLTGPFCQYNAGPSFSLIRFETNGPAVWFKAVGEPNLREFPITMHLAELFPTFVPEILGTKPRWNGWLSREVDGTNLGEAKDIALWERAATDLAILQIQTISRSEPILHSSAHDLRPDSLLASIDPFFELVARLMENQPQVPPPLLNPQELSLLKLRIEDALRQFENLKVPNALGHLDLNPRNIMVSVDRCVFLDWAEACVGPPFLCLEYLLQHFRREMIAANAALESELVDAYKAPWRQLLADDVIHQALTLTPSLAVYAYAAGTGTWKDEERLRDPKIAGYFRSLARRMNREVIQLVEGRSPCLN
jgi:hypothetical protein